jgi:biopolymer transport protein ExbB
MNGITILADNGPLIWQGGPLTWLLLGCSIFSIGIFLERYLAFHRAKVSVSDLMIGLANLVRRKNFAEALHECAGTPGPVARVVHAAILRHDAPRHELKEIVQEAGQLEVPGLEKNLAVLHNLAYVTPLIGLLGTLLGLMRTFVLIKQNSGLVTSEQLSAGLYEALITSALGIVVAVPAFTFYSYLASFARTLMHDMERAGIEIVNLIHDSRTDRSLIVEFRPEPDQLGGLGPGAPGQSPFKGPKAGGAR